MSSHKKQLKHINTLIFDYDGVLTDGSVIIASDGDMLRTGNVRDGYALQLAVKKGFNVAIISGGKSTSIVKRFTELGISDVFIGVINKIEAYENYLKQNNLDNNTTLYMGDDIPDYEIMKKTGIAACPADAAEEIKSISHYISPFSGGKGCARDIIEQILKIQGKWFNQDAFHW